MKVVIIEYNAGNTQSVLNALNRFKVDIEVTSSIGKIISADKVIFPGVGEANTAMNSLRENNLIEVIKKLKQPVLGICLGMQLFYALSHENNTPCLGIISGNIEKFKIKAKIPHMGWNCLYSLKSDLFKDICEKDYVYFVHSFYAPISEHTIATCSYCNFEFSAAIKKNNFYATQFHPEKSSQIGAKILKNFIDL